MGDEAAEDVGIVGRSLGPEGAEHLAHSPGGPVGASGEVGTPGTPVQLHYGCLRARMKGSLQTSVAAVLLPLAVCRGSSLRSLWEEG